VNALVHRVRWAGPFPHSGRLTERNALMLRYVTMAGTCPPSIVPIPVGDLDLI